MRVKAHVTPALLEATVTEVILQPTLLVLLDITVLKEPSTAHSILALKGITMTKLVALPLENVLLVQLATIVTRKVKLPTLNRSWLDTITLRPQPSSPILQIPQM
jgi:hypothetical protein